MRTIQPARLKPGITLERLPLPGSPAAQHAQAGAQGSPAAPATSGASQAPAPARVIRGRALVFWDPKVPG